MADDSPRERPGGARPVADLPFEGPHARIEETVRRWAAELMSSRPLAALGQVPLATIASEAPGLCEQLIGALRSERELDVLLGLVPAAHGQADAYPAKLAAIAGAHDGRAVVEAVESLRGVVWEALIEESLAPGQSGRARERLLGDLSDRLAHVCALLAAHAVVSPPSGLDASGDPPPRAASAGAADSSRIVILDEGPEEAEDRSAQRAAAAPPEARPQDVGELPGAEIEIRDARGAEGPSAWIHSIGRQLERFGRDGLAFAVVLMEVDGGAVRPDEETLERVLGRELREAGGGTLTRERPGRYWLVVPRADRIGAHALAARLEQALLAAGASRRTPLRVLSGTALCPEDGVGAAALAAHADVGLYAARWESRSAGTLGAAEGSS
jgi:hypothetical protein